MQNDNKISSELFICHTPLHILLAVAIRNSLDSATDSSHLAIGTRFSHAKQYKDFFESWDKNPFSSVSIIDTPHQPGEHSSTLSKAEKRKQIKSRRVSCHKQVKALIEQVKPTTIYSGNDATEFHQLAIYTGKSSGYTKRAVYFDDGMGSYVIGERNNHKLERKIRYLLKELKFKPWRKYNAALGAYFLTDEVLILAPELREYNTGKDVKKIDNDIFLTNDYKNFSLQFAQYLGFDLSSLRNCENFLVVGKSNYCIDDPTYATRLQTFCNALSKNDIKIAVKHHPREKESDPFNLLKHKNTIEIPRELGFEYVLSQIPKNASLVGEKSTALITAKLFRPDLDIIALTTSSKKSPLACERLFKSIGVLSTSNPLEAAQETI